MSKKSNFNVLMSLYQDEGSYISATVKYIHDFLKIEIEEFKTSDLPDEWIQCLYKEAREMKTVKSEEFNTLSFFDLFKENS